MRLDLCILVVAMSMGSFAGLGLTSCASTNDAQRRDSDAATDSGKNDNDDANSDVGWAPTLRLSLDPTLDQPDDDVKVTSIAAARLLDKSSAEVAVAALVGTEAWFPLSRIAAGSYFIEVNGDADDLVPTRIDDPRDDLLQRVGQKLRASYIGPPSKPTYRINTYPDGSVVPFSTGVALVDERPYVLVGLASSTLESAVLGTGAALTSLTLNRCAGHAFEAADAWLLNTTGQDHHGDEFNATGGPANCGGCHGDYWRKLYAFSEITPSRGWCFRCHNGTDGSSAGFVDPTK
jgi:hypothetical protein